jgi:hypothetical protein
MSTLAVFIALGGTSYAVARNSIGTAQLKNNAVTSTKVRNGSLKKGDLAADARIGQRGPRGPQGPPGGSGAAAAQEPWKPLNYIGGWADYGVYEGGGYRKKADGDVQLRGLVTQTGGLPAQSPIIAVLPTGYRPAKRQVLVSYGGNPDTAARVDVLPDGSVLFVVGPTAEMDYVTLSGLSFSTD